MKEFPSLGIYADSSSIWLCCCCACTMPDRSAPAPQGDKDMHNAFIVHCIFFSIFRDFPLHFFVLETFPTCKTSFEIHLQCPISSIFPFIFLRMRETLQTCWILCDSFEEGEEEGRDTFIFCYLLGIEIDMNLC